MILAWRKDDPCDVRYVQVEVECPCDEYLPGGGYPYDGVEGQLWDPVEGCDGAASLSMLVSGFSGACVGLNGAYGLVRAAPYVWTIGGVTLKNMPLGQLQCGPGNLWLAARTAAGPPGALQRVLDRLARGLGFAEKGRLPSPVKGPKGNQEYFLCLVLEMS